MMSKLDGREDMDTQISFQSDVHLKSTGGMDLRTKSFTQDLQRKRRSRSR